MTCLFCSRSISWSDCVVFQTDAGPYSSHAVVSTRVCSCPDCWGRLTKHDEDPAEVAWQDGAQRKIHTQRAQVVAPSSYWLSQGWSVHTHRVTADELA